MDMDGPIELLLKHEVALPFLYVLPLDPLEILRLNLLVLVTVLTDVALVEHPLEEVVVSEVDG